MVKRHSEDFSVFILSPVVGVSVLLLRLLFFVSMERKSVFIKIFIWHFHSEEETHCHHEPHRPPCLMMTLKEVDSRRPLSISQSNAWVAGWQPYVASSILSCHYTLQFVASSSGSFGHNKANVFGINGFKGTLTLAYRKEWGRGTSSAPVTIHFPQLCPFVFRNEKYFRSAGATDRRKIPFNRTNAHSRSVIYYIMNPYVTVEW